MSFWLEEDDASPVVASLQSQSQPAFVCETCGSTEFYHDTSTGRDVCQECFTQSQQLYSQPEETLDYEDVMALAAKTRGGNLVRSKRARNDNKPKVSRKLPLDGLDQSVPFPDLETCLDGMQRTLKSSVKILARFLFPNKRELQRSLISTVGQLWVGYLRAYADAAEHYGALYPELRFSLRDAFLSNSHKKMVFSHLAWKAAKELEEKGDTEQADSIKWDAKLDEDCLDGNASSSNPSNRSKKRPLSPPRPSKLGEESPGNSRPDETSMKSPAETSTLEGNKIPVLNETTTTTAPKKKRRMTIDRVVQASSSKSRQGYKEAALKLKPSMDFCATLLWLAVCKSGVTSFECIQWIAEGCLQPLMNAFDHFLPRELQRKLMPIRSFFRMSLVPSPYYLEASATILAVACRMKTHDTFVPKPRHKDELCFWSTACLPLVVAKLVTNAGLDQEVLNRSLALLNLPVPGRLASQSLPKPLKNVSRNEVIRNEDVLAVIAIACLMDPNCKFWTYHRAKRSPLPYNECHFSLLSSGPALETYLDFVETNVLDPTSSLVWDNFVRQQAHGDNVRTKDSGYSSDESSDGMLTVKPCSVLAGAQLDAENRPSMDSRHETASMEWIGCSERDKDPRHRLLISFLAHSAHAKESRIRQKMKLFLQGASV